MDTLRLDKKIVVNEAGEPLEVIIPYEQYLDFIETYGLDLTGEENAELREAEADLEAGNNNAFVSLDDVKKELGIKCTR